MDQWNLFFNKMNLMIVIIVWKYETHSAWKFSCLALGT